MNLILTVVDAPHSLGSRSRFVLREGAGLIGRDVSCDWVLPDPRCEVSRRHARVEFHDGDYWIEDLGSVNGVLISGSLERLNPDVPLRLESRQKFVIGGYTIQVEVQRDLAPARPVRVVPSEEPPWRQQRERYPEPSSPPMPQPVEDYLEPVDPLPPPVGNWAPPAVESAPPTPDGGAVIIGDFLEGSSILQQHPRPEPPKRVETPPVPTPPPSEGRHPVPPGPAHGPGQADEGRRLLEAIGIDPGLMDAGLAEEIGRSFRVALHGLVDLLRARAEVKAQFRMEASVFQARGNNPLKLAATIQEVLEELFVHRNHRNLPAPEAVAAAIDDLKWHQLALMAGTRHAFFEMLRSFDPEVLARRFEEDSGGRGFAWVGGAKPWEQYVDMYEGIRRDKDTYFKQVFGEAFVEEYERQVRELEKKFGLTSTEGKRRMESQPRRGRHER